MERSGRAGMIIAMAALVILVGFVYLYQRPAPTAPVKSASATSTTPASGSEPVAGEGCTGCVGVGDNGTTLALASGSRLTILLPQDTYNAAKLSVAPAGTLKAIAGVAAPAGASVSAFEATAPGTATIVVPASSRDNPPYALTIITLDSAHAWENGMTVVTKLDANQTIPLSQHQRFVINLGNDLSWSLTFDPSNSISRVAGSVSTGGIQGVYEAETVGTSTLMATGAPICSAGQACPQFRISIPINFDIQ